MSEKTASPTLASVTADQGGRHSRATAETEAPFWVQYTAYARRVQDAFPRRAETATDAKAYCYRWLWAVCHA